MPYTSIRSKQYTWLEAKGERLKQERKVDKVTMADLDGSKHAQDEEWSRFKAVAVRAIESIGKRGMHSTGQQLCVCVCVCVCVCGGFRRIVFFLV